MMFDVVIDTDTSKCISVAQSEGNRPLHGVNPDIEELAFPSIFCRDRRPNNKERKRPVKYSEICKSELRTSSKKPQFKLIQDKVWLA